MSITPKCTALAAFAALSLWTSNAAQAGYETVTVQCQDSRPFLNNTVICLTKGSFRFRSDGDNVQYMVNVVAPPSHCSDVAYQFYLPTRDSSIGTTGRLRPGAVANVDIGRGFVAGTHELQIVAIGFISGCNAGAIHSWAANVAVVPVP